MMRSPEPSPEGSLDPARSEEDAGSSSRARRVEEALTAAGIHLAVEETGDTLVLSGMVDTEADREAAMDIAAEVAGDGTSIDEDVTVSGAVGKEMRELTLTESEVEGFEGADPGLEEDERALPGDFTDQSTLSAPSEAQGAALSDQDITQLAHESDLVSEGDRVYVPPTDPVGTDTEVIGGFGSSSMDSIEVDRSSDGTLGDEAIRDAVLRELREDAATTALVLEVEVDAGVVRLFGRVADLVDVEHAEEVAARVPGVMEVIEELVVENLSEAPEGTEGEQ